MPRKSGETTDTPRAPEITKPDYFALQAEREEMMKALGKLKPAFEAGRISLEDVFALVSLIAEHSIKDGLEAAEQCEFSELEKRRLLLNPNIFLKHNELISWLPGTVKDNQKNITDYDLNAGTFLREVDGMLSNLTKIKRHPHKFSSAAQGIADRINHYYLPFIAQHKVVPLPTPEDPRTKTLDRKIGLPRQSGAAAGGKEIVAKKLSGEQLADDLLEKLSRGYERNIFASFPRLLAAQYLRKTKLPPEAIISFTKKRSRSIKKFTLARGSGCPALQQFYQWEAGGINFSEARR